MQKKILLSILLLSLLCFPASAGDEIEINEKLNENAGGTYTLPADTFTVSDQILIPPGTTLRGEVSDDGELLTKIMLADNVKLGEHEYIIEATGDNCKVLYLDCDGNGENQVNVPTNEYGQQTGFGYQDFIGAEHQNNIEVAYCNFYNNLGDGLRATYCKGVKFHDNTASKGGHDVLYAIQSENVEVYNNYVEPRCNSAFRFLDVNTGQIYNNTVVFKRMIEGVRSTAGPAIQLQNDKGKMKNIEVCGNYIYDSWGPAFWIVGKTNDGNQEAWIHHNVIYRAGANPSIFWGAGVIASGYDNILLEHNVFDSSYRGGIVYYAYSPSWGTQAHSDIQKNIFVDAQPGASDKKGGYGIQNLISKQTVSSSENCYYGNPAGVTSGCEVSESDIFSNPRKNPSPCDIEWNGEEWIIPGVEPSKMGDAEGAYDDEDPITPEEEEEYEWSTYFLNGLMSMEFPENAVTQDTPESLEYFVKTEDLEEKGKIAGTVKIIGWNNLTRIDNEFYVSSYEDAIIYSRVVRNPTLNMWSGGISKTKKSYNLTVENGTAIETMTVETYWYNLKMNHITGQREKSKLKMSTYTFKDSYYPAPKRLEQPKKVTGIVYQYYDSEGNPIKWDMKVHDTGLQSITYKIGKNETTHIFLVGVSNTTEDGVKFTDYSSLEHWEGARLNNGDWIIGQGEYNPAQITVTAHGVYKDYNNINFEIVKKEATKEPIKSWFYPTIIFYGYSLLFIRFMWRKTKERFGY